MRIIGINLLKETPRTLRKCLEPGWYPFVDSNLKFSHNVLWPEYDNPKVPNDFFSLNKSNPLEINVSAVVGKNGTGKSTIVELLLAVINNVSMRLSSIRNTQFVYKIDDTYVHDIYADVFYELDNHTYCINVRDTQLIVFEKDENTGRTDRLSEDALKKTAIKDFLAKHFFYNISINYGLHSFNSDNHRSQMEKANNLHRELWFDKYFHRVDGYTIPLTLVPDRNKGVIDINKEEDLARKRLAKIALWLKARNQKQLIDGYEPLRLIWFCRKWNNKETLLLIERLLFDKKPSLDQSQRFNKLYDILRKYWVNKLDNVESRKIDNTILLSAINYLVYKTIKICVNYSKYGDLLFKYNTSVYNYENIGRIVDTLMVDSSHVATKIRATMAFLSSSLYTSKNQVVHVSELLNLLKGKKNLDEIELLLPPPFFSYDIEYTKKGEQEAVTLDDLSSGEKQMIFSVSAAIEHLANLSSIPTNDTNRVAYHHVNLVFDEAELYFHPEFQRLFIYKIISVLSSGFIDKRRIRSVNILMVTHSPFILSDIPAGNILFLGKKQDKRYRTLAANIYDLLQDEFFMDRSIGEISSRYMQKIFEIEQIQDKEERIKMYAQEKQSLNFFVREIGDPYLRRIMTGKVREFEYLSMTDSDIDERIKELNLELIQLNRLKK